MKFTTQDIIAAGNFILSRSKTDTFTRQSFKNWLQDLEAHPSSPNVAIGQLYDFCVDAFARREMDFAVEMRHQLFKLVKIKEPRELSCLGFFVPPQEYDLCISGSFKKAVKKLQAEIENIRNADNKPVLKMA